MKSKNEVRAELLSYLEVQDRIDNSSIVYIPMGALEFHGPHLPIGLDGLTAHGVCISSAEKTGGVVLPPIYQGTGGEHSDYPWTLMMPTDDAIRANLTATLSRLQSLGVKKTLILSGHFANEQRALLVEIADQWTAQNPNGMVLICVTLGDFNTHAIEPDHAATFESMLLSALSPELVHIERLPDFKERPSIDPEGNSFGPHRHDRNHALWGAFGPDPRLAEMDKSQELLDSAVQWLVSLVDS